MERSSSGTMYLRPAAIPFVVAALALPIVAAVLIGVVVGAGIGLGLAAGALVLTGLVVVAARSLPDGEIEVAARHDGDRRVLVVVTAEVTPLAVERIRGAADGADDVRVVVPVRSRAIDEWLSATDGARERAQDALARTAGALVAAGLPISGALGDGDAGQALEDELRSYPAQAVVVVAEPGADDPLGGAASQLRLPLTRVSPR